MEISEMNLPKKKSKVLLVDDELINIKILADVLKDEYGILFATSGQDAIRIATEATPDLILLDIVMPGMDGYKVCEKLRSEPRTAAIPIIFVTALDSTEQEIKGLQNGALDYVTKPFNSDIVKVRVRNQLQYKDVLLASASSESVDDPGVAAMTPRQREIFEWVKAGKTNWEIAQIIGCSRDNVKYHVRQILRLSGTSSRTQAAAGHVKK
jgi:DNA-binding NarL/FixJ family response regulator